MKTNLQTELTKSSHILQCLTLATRIVQKKLPFEQPIFLFQTCWLPSEFRKMSFKSSGPIILLLKYFPIHSMTIATFTLLSILKCPSHRPKMANDLRTLSRSKNTTYSTRQVSNPLSRLFETRHNRCIVFTYLMTLFGVIRD